MDWKGFKRLGRWELAALVTALLVAGVLRLAWPGLTEFKRDEALLLARALDMAEFRQFHVRGIASSVGFPNFPMSVWLYTLPLLVWRHVYAATLFTGLLNTTAVLGCWWLARRYWGGRVALAAALLFAVSPWAVFHSQKVWAQNLLPPLVVAWAICTALAFVEGRGRYVIWHLLLLAVAVQVHFAALALVPATLLLLILFRRRVAWRLALAGGFLGLLTALPFFIYLLQSGTGLQAAFGGDSGSAGLAAWRYLWLLSSGRDIHALAGPEAFDDYLARVPDLTVVQLLWGLLAAAGLLLLARRAWQRRGQGDARAEMSLIVLVWFFVPPLFYSLPWLPVQLHYLLLTYPAQYLAAGVGLWALIDYLQQNRPAGWRWAGWAVLGLTAAAQVWVWLVLLNFINTRATPGGYGTPVRFHLQAAEAVRSELAQVEGGEVLIAGQSERVEQDEFAAVYDLLLRDLPRRFVDLSRSALFPDGPAVALIDRRVAGPTGVAYRQAAEQLTALPLRPGEGELLIAVLPPSAAPAPQARLEPPLLFANWVQIYGYDPPALQADGTAWWQMYWRTGDNPDPANYQFFNHLIDGTGERAAQQDAAAFSPWQWRQGDTVLSVFVLPWPAAAEGPLTMRAGLYTYPELQNVPLMDVAGNPAGDAAEIPLR